MDIQENLSLIGKKLVIKEAFYGLFLLGLDKRVNNNISTAGVSKNGINILLEINKNFWESLSDNYRQGVFKHEILHIAFNHLFTRQYFSDKILFNIAADLEINQYIKPEWLPDFALKLEDYNLSNYPQHGTKFYYDKLKQDLKNPGSNPNLDAIYSAMQNEQKVICSHESWKDFEDLSEGEQKMIEKQIQHQSKDIADYCKSRGLVPSELSDFIDALFENKPPVMDWRMFFRRFINGSNEVYTKKTRRKDSKRISGNPGLKIRTKPRGIIYWDQSGSVSDEEHKMFFNEVKHMYKAGLNFDIAPFNTQVFQPYKYKGENKYQVSGGGTSFTPITNHFNEVCKNYSFGIILTDGEAEVPPKFKKTMLWVLTPQGRNVEQCSEFPGIKIKMNKI